jgi:5-(carboxyamino)imidazole ribonucleotide synthase
MILPGAALGVLGGGQLGRMFTLAARRMGYRVVVLDPAAESPAGEVADVQLKADYTDRAALAQMARQCAAVTVEFENIPAQTLQTLAGAVPVRPGADALAIAQDRIREKQFLAGHGFATAAFAVVRERSELATALKQVGRSAILKRASLGYDGKGQARVRSLPEAEQAFDAMGAVPCVLEQRLKLDLELSVILARGADGTTTVFPLAENRHEGGILDVSIAPARVSAALARKARTTAVGIAHELDYVGVLAVEFFVSARSLLVNEIAPRPHNSGHYTLDACLSSQFEQQVRTLCGLPLADPALLRPAVMVNLLGDLWDAGEPGWDAILDEPRAKLHLYGKGTARPGRKMGHYTCLGDSVDDALKLALKIRRRLKRRKK